MEKKQFVMLFKFRARHRQTDSEYTYMRNRVKRSEERINLKGHLFRAFFTICPSKKLSGVAPVPLYPLLQAHNLVNQPLRAEFVGVLSRSLLYLAVGLNH